MRFDEKSLQVSLERYLGVQNTLNVRLGRSLLSTSGQEGAPGSVLGPLEIHNAPLSATDALVLRAFRRIELNVTLCSETSRQSFCCHCCPILNVLHDYTGIRLVEFNERRARTDFNAGRRALVCLGVAEKIVH